MARKKYIEKLIIKEYNTEPKELLSKWYWEDELSQRKISEILNVTPAVVCNLFAKYNIPKRVHNHWVKGSKHSDKTKQILREKNLGRKHSQETRKKLSAIRKGVSVIGSSLRFQGKRNRSDGYIQTYYPNHPFAAREGYVMEHRLVMENKIGRLLKPEEEVHHINHDRKDNRPENLHLFSSKKAHMKFHMLERRGKKEELKYDYK